MDGDINLFDYATKDDLKNATWIDTSKVAAKSALVSLKAKVDKLDIEKLIPVPADLSKLSDVVKFNVTKKTAYNKLVAKGNKIDTSGFVNTYSRSIQLVFETFFFQRRLSTEEFA